MNITHVHMECNTATGFIQGALSKAILNTELMFDHLLYIKGFTSTCFLFYCRNHVRCISAGLYSEARCILYENLGLNAVK